MDDRIEEILKIATTLRPIIFDEGQGKNIFPCITFHFYNETGAVYGSGKAVEETAGCQIDFWYKAKTEAVKQAIADVKQAIVNETKFTHPEKGHLFETDTKIYHTYFTFTLIKERDEL